MLRITTKGRYALRAMLDLAMHQQDAPVTREEIAERQELPATYLAQLFSALTKAGLVESVRGPGGGYVLTRPADQITAGEILRAVEGPISLTACVVDEEVCGRAGRCSLRKLYEGLSDAIAHYLDTITLADIGAGNIPHKFAVPAAEKPAESLQES